MCKPKQVNLCSDDNCKVVCHDDFLIMRKVNFCMIKLSIPDCFVRGSKKNMNSTVSFVDMFLQWLYLI